jgi:hypothetical protein
MKITKHSQVHSAYEMMQNRGSLNPDRGYRSPEMLDLLFEIAGPNTVLATPKSQLGGEFLRICIEDRKGIRCILQFSCHHTGGVVECCSPPG